MQTEQSVMPAPVSMANATPTSEQGITMVIGITDIMYLFSLFVMETFYANTCAQFSGPGIVECGFHKRTAIQISEGLHSRLYIHLYILA